MSGARTTMIATLLLACDRSGPPPPTPPPPVPRDAPPDASIDAPPDAAPLEAALSCDGKMLAKGWLKIRIDPTTLRGTIDRVTAGKALMRKINIVARRDGADYTLLFDSYSPEDHTSIRGNPAPRPRNERLVKGTSIVGRLVAVPPGETRLYVEHEVDWVTDSYLVVQDGYTECAPATR